MALSERVKPYRDSSLFVLGLEGEVSGAEYQYFMRVMELDALDHRRVRFVMLPTPVERHDSDPQAVMRRVEEYTAANDLQRFDRVWLLLDTDSWGPKKLSEVAQQARTRKFSLALSNPCFEIWLIMHHDVCDSGPIVTAAERRRSAVAKSTWRGGKAAISTDGILRACGSARRLADSDGPSARWPSCPGSGVYLLFEDLAARQAWRAGASTHRLRPSFKS